MPNVVEEYRMGGTVIRICSDHFVKPEEVDRVMDEVMEANWSIWDSLTDEERIQANKELA